MKLKTILGIILIVLSLAAMFFWETAGREMLTTTSILVCSEDVKKGQSIDLTSLKAMKLSRDCILEGALTPEDAQALEGMVASVDLAENQQVLKSYFANAKNEKNDDKSIYVIPKEWIFSRSSALRGGDTVSIYRMPEKEKLGTYTVAFVRDASEQEVTDIEPGARGVLDRKDSGRMISGIEIICTLNDYSKLYESVVSKVSVSTELQNDEEAEAETADQADEEAAKQNKTETAEEIRITANLLVVMEDAI